MSEHNIDYLKMELTEYKTQLEELESDIITKTNEAVKCFIRKEMARILDSIEFKEFQIWKLERDGE